MNTFSVLLRWLRRPINLIALLLVLTPPLLILLMTQAYFVREAPYIDQWSLGVYVATRAQAGTLTIGDVTSQYGAHHIIPSNLTIAAFSLLNRYDVSQTIHIQWMLSVIRWGLLLGLVGIQQTRLLAPSAVLLSLFVFYPTQLHLWEYSFNMPWLYVQVFLLAALITIATTKPGPVPFLIVAILAICATFTIAVGLVTWVVLPVAMWLAGYRQWRYVFMWAAVTAVTVGVYFSPLLPVFERLDLLIPDFASDAPLATPGQILRGVAVYLSAPMLFFNVQLAFVITVGGVAWLCGNAWHIWRRNLMPTQHIGIWLAIAFFALGSAALTMLGRAGAIAPVDAGKQTRYFNVGVNLWITCSVFALVIIGARGQRRWRVYSNLTGIAIVVACLVFTSFQTVFLLRTVYGHNVFEATSQPNADYDNCFLTFPLHRDDACIPRDYGMNHHAQPAFIYQLAVYRLALFRDYPAQSILPEEAPVIVHTNDEWLSLYVREFMLPDVPQLHLTQQAQWDDPSQFDPPLENVVYSEVPAEVVREFVETHGTVYYLNIPEVAASSPDVLRAVETGTIDSVDIAAPRYIDARFTLRRIQHGQ